MDNDIISQDENSIKDFDLPEDIWNQPGISRSAATGLPLTDSR